MIDDRKTILYIGGGLPDKTAAAHRVLSNGKALREYGYTVVFLNYDTDMVESGIKKTSVQGFEVLSVGYPRGIKQWLNYLFSIKLFAKALSFYPDISTVIYYDPPTISLLRLKKYCKKKNVRLISDCTEWHTTSHLSGFKRFVKYIDINLTLRYAQKKIDGLIVISSFWQRYYKNVKMLRVIPLIDKNEAKWNATTKPDLTEKRVFVYAGNMGNEKDRLNNIIDAFYSIGNKSFLLYIIGITKTQYLNKFPYQAHIIDELESQITFWGRMAHINVLTYIKKADFSFLIRESNRKNNAGFPTKFGESVACGTPVIASDFSDVKEYVDKYALGIIVDSVDNIEKGIRRALTMNNKDIEQLRTNCLTCSAFDYRQYSQVIGNYISEIEMVKNEQI